MVDVLLVVGVVAMVLARRIHAGDVRTAVVNMRLAARRVVALVVRTASRVVGSNHA